MAVYSFSTVLMAVLTSNLLLALVVLCFFHTKLMINAGYKLLMSLVLFTVLRFLLPFEIPNARIIILPAILSKPLGYFQYSVFTHASTAFSFWNIVELVWLAGALIGLLRYGILCLRTHRYIILHQKVVTGQEPYASKLEQICAARHRRNPFQVIELPGIDTPMLYGVFRPRILIPEGLRTSDIELYCYLSHEATHHFHHDLLLKTLVKLITIAYWWNPFCLLLNDRANMVLEMRVDDALTKSDTENTVIYTRCLLDMAERVIDYTNVPQILSMSFLARNKKTENITKRVQMLLANQQKKNLTLNLVLFSAVTAIYLLSYAFIPEVYYTPDTIAAQPLLDYPTFDSGFAILLDDSTYDIYCNNIKCENVSSLTNYPADIPIYTYDTLPENIIIHTKESFLNAQSP